MGIFGAADITDIPDDPYFIPENDYRGILGGAELKTLNDGQTKLIVKVIVDDQSSRYHGREGSKWLPVFDNLEEQDFADSKIQQQLSYLKRDLKWLGITEDEMNLDTEGLTEAINNRKGTEVVFQVKEYNKKGEDQKKASSVNSIWLAELYQGELA
jgi:hypothetical protein